VGFLDKAKELADQAQQKLDEAQKQFNERQAAGAPVETGRPRPEAGSANANPDPFKAIG
jgi:hypothetical protein